MSGNRANASAIQRRTTNPPPIRSSTSSSASVSSRYAPPPPPQSNPKLSVSDAIALITIRLGRVETFINQLPPLDQLESFSSSQTEEPANNMSLVNDNVFQSIVTRLEKLEKSQNTNIDKKVSDLELKILSLEQLISSLEQKINVLPRQIETKDIDDKITSLNTQLDQLKDTTIINDKVTSLNTQLDQLKDTVLSLQTYTMNTNTKLIDLIITNTEINDNQEENEDITKHLENLFRHNFDNFEQDDNNTNLFEETLNEETTSEEQTTDNKLTLSEEDLSNLSINL
jgi:predicted  nucleic acid-binding Zn-ribbon protein